MFLNKQKGHNNGIPPRRFFSLIFSLFLILISQATEIIAQQDRERVKVGVFENKPLSFKDEQNIVAGIYPEIIREIAKKEKWDLEFILDSWSGCLEGLKTGEIDLMISIVYSKERDKVFDFSEEAIVTAWGQVYTKEDKKISSILDLDGKNVAVMAKDINGKHFIELCRKFNVKCNFIKAKIYEDICNLILSEEVDAGVINNVNGPFLQRKYNIHSTTILFNPVSASFAVPEGTNQDILIAIDSHVSQWKKDKNSIYYDIINKWYGNIQKRYLIPYKLVTIIIFITVGISLFLYFWMRVLKAQVKARTKEVLESEERFRSVFESKMIGILFWNSEGIITDANETFLEMVGYAKEEILSGKVFWKDLTPKEYTEQDNKAFQELSAKGVMTPIEKEYIRKDGSRFPILQGGAFLPDSTFRGVAFVLDIGKRKQIEKELDMMQMHYNEFIITSSDAVSYWKVPDGLRADLPLEDQIEMLYHSVCIDGNRASWEGFALKRKDQLIGKEFIQLVTERTYDKGFADFIKNNYHISNYELSLIMTDDQIYHGLESWHGIVENGILTHIWTDSKNITELKKAEEALRESEAKYRSMMEAMNDATYICSSDFQIEYMNPAMIEKIGRDATGEKCHKAVHGLEEKCPWCIQEKVIKGETIKTELAKPEEDEVYFVSNSPIFHGDGSVSTLSVYRDITEIKKLESRIQQAQKMEAIGTLAGGIAHDFNNILSPIMIHTELIMEQLTDESVQSQLKEVFKASERARDLVQQILTFSRQTDQERQLLSVGPVIKEALKLLRSALPTTIEIKQYIEVKSDTILADPTQIHQIIMNLCTNAGHAMRKKGGVLEVTLEDEYLDPKTSDRFPHMNPGPYLRLSVRDTGTGIDSSLLERIFDPYFTTKEQGEGTGLGLSVVHGIVKSHDGMITVDSELGKGSSFHVYLPILEKEISHDVGIKLDVPKGTERILLVDDEMAMIDANRPMLEKLGYDVVARTSSIEALEAFRNNPGAFDLVITDMTMPNMTGAEMARGILKIRPDIPIILCTGYSELIDTHRASEIGIRALVMKPIIRSEMAVTIRDVLDSKENS